MASSDTGDIHLTQLDGDEVQEETIEYAPAGKTMASTDPESPKAPSTHILLHIIF